uniref:Gustatory receptor n=1 Tax=Eogystia hippophaecolus TaxID=1206364 RepID=A0A1B3P5U2_EOGHI|nr:gustatory receptor [Eogystia hippophaecolus]
MSMSMVTTTVYHIVLLYQYITVIIKQIDNRKYFNTNNMVFFLTNYFVSSVLILVAAQKVYNESVKLKMSLARLNNTLMAWPEETEILQAIRDFQRIVNTEPIIITLLTAMPLKMPLLLSMVSIATTYAIIALQFNHVV